MTEKDRAALTANEERLLCTFSANEARIRSGALTDTERGWLKQIREMKEITRRKYPSYSFRWISFAPALGTQQAPELAFSLKGEAEVYTVRLLSPGCAADNFYGFVISPEFQAGVRQIFPDARVRVSIRSLMDIGTCRDLSLAGFARESLPVFPHCNLVFPLYRLSQSLLQSSEQAVRAAALPGFYQIQVVYQTDPEKLLYAGSFSVSPERTESKWH